MIHAMDDMDQRQPEELAGVVMAARVARVDGQGKVELVFPFDDALVASLKAALPREARTFTGPPRRVWVIEPTVTNLRALAVWCRENDVTVRECVKRLAAELVEASREALKGSRARTAIFEVEGLTGELLPYQQAGIAYMVQALGAGGSVLNADEMGLGKTVQALGAVSKLGAWPAVVVCPASVKWNWKKEVEKWLPGVGVEVLGANGWRPLEPAKVLVVNYDILGKHVEDLRAREPESVIFDEAHYLKNAKTKRWAACAALARGVKNLVGLTGTPIENRVPDLLPVLRLLRRVNEFGGEKAFRTRYLGQKLVPVFVRGCRAIGPLPVEPALAETLRVGDTVMLHEQAWPRWTVAARSAPKIYHQGTKAPREGSGLGAEEISIALRPVRVQGPDVMLNGADFNAANYARVVMRLGAYEPQNLGELNSKLRSFCMVRRTKAEVLPELPAKRRVIVPVEISNGKEYKAAQKDVLGYIAAKAVKDPAFRAEIAGLDDEAKLAALVRRAREAALRAERGEDLVKLNVLRRLSAVGKRAAIEEWMGDFLEGGGSLVMFGVHREIVNGMGEKWKVPALTGDTPARERQRMIEVFAAGKTRLFPANLRAGGTGVDGLQRAASDVGFWEIGWTPAALEQAEDRLARLGQQSAVTAWYFMGRGTIDWMLWELVNEKREASQAAVGDR